MSPEYILEIFRPSYYRHNMYSVSSTFKLDLPFRNSSVGQKTLCHLAPRKWNDLPAQIELWKNLNTFKHDIKKLCFEKLQKKKNDIFIHY